ncbi:hypothetical protein CC85DRAFT_283645 [Cutaneotrichosporon oleaginosum]|uniref:N-acetyltransferase domain-containing protein n=1 Tax=Cutaneotrichosporon oleaginosum TaxID=879819 RepID=A0A0J0XTL8_9TREE|nr:uncharacterized protein CC85DRAFT_283645 [Cutaneotrichosporon oleaginosum]KLT44412.1 hypothetical protein CC85DRAFT_283645 [Cutaneotrichosporon oleaginosum]TXT07867.1 hypothetical protein COLE_04791 [Cutaneotrichosporon oleaginosum]
MDRTSPAYAAALAGSAQWDTARNEPYLQLPSFPDLRLIPYRPGIAGDLVALFNHHVVGKRLFTLPYPCVVGLRHTDGSMDRAFAEKMEADLIAKQAPVLARLRARREGQREGDDEGEVAWPFKALWSEAEGRVVGDIYLWPNTLEPVWDERGKMEGSGETQITEASVLALPPARQSWMIGYVLEPALYGRGVMSEAIGCVLHGWVRPVMGIGEVVAIIQDDNVGSEAVAKRNGFVYRREEVTPWPEEKGGGIHVNGYYTRDMRA